MTDYINRDVAIAATFAANGIGNSQYRDACDVAERLRKIPAADVVPMGFHERCLQEEIKKRFALERKHGEWMKAVQRLDESWVCSECMEEFVSVDADFTDYAHFCPNCGAYMRGDNDGNS